MLAGISWLREEATLGSPINGMTVMMKLMNSYAMCPEFAPTDKEG